MRNEQSSRAVPETGVDSGVASASVRPEPIDVAAWREAMVGVTPGPWYSESVDTEGSYGSGEDTTEGFKSYVVRTEAQKSYGDDAVVCDALNSGTAEVHEEFDEDGVTAWDEPGRCTMAWIARCSPAGISTLLDALDEAMAALREKEERVKALEEALGPFARADRALGDTSGSDRTFRLETDTGYREISRNDFRRARSALSSVQLVSGSREQRGNEEGSDA